MKKPELLAPAGSLKSLRYAYAYGADAVYVGLPRYSLRVRENAFDNEGLMEGIRIARELGKQLYVACNIAAHNSKVATFLEDMDPVVAMQPDALIMSDPGLIHMARKRWPEMVIHLSVQANVVNHAAVDFWQEQGISRIILSRELDLNEVAEIRQRCPDMELECFIHGALCIAYSGRCLLSGYMNHRDANQGACTNACRWDYTPQEAVQTLEGPLALKEKPEPPKEAPPPFLIEEKARPGEVMEAEEDEHGTYIFNSKDLRAIEHVETMAKMGIDSLKIEGRTKSFFYTARTVQIYRQAIDAAAEGKPFDPIWMQGLNELANRGYTQGFYDRHAPDEEMQNYWEGSTNNSQRFVAEVVDQLDDGQKIVVEVKNRFELGGAYELMLPGGSILMSVESIHNMQGDPMTHAPGSGHRVVIPLPKKVDATYGLLIKKN
uniref:Putative peptidase [yegQ] n=1 Tax=Magnetococcus massalia (strain MO-1) TaxID=451514 RepID=A0A1S7LHM1_MAGMO|nr:putative peptidase [yegQ] [Candidatus Magnetococcus massalia]